MKPLTYANCEEPGITREQTADGFAYCAADGQRITDAEEIARLNAIALPPAYTGCWFNPDPAGHIQATGIDARGRKQYRYHPDFRLHREAEKFAMCRQFGERLPGLRAQVRGDLAQRGFGRDKAAACVVALLDLAAIRVGNEAYRKANRTHGATTLLKRHVAVKSHAERLRFRGKGGVTREVTISDRVIAAQVRRLQDLPGQRLFQFRDDDGEWRMVTSTDVNAYIQAHSGPDFTAKQFRTWHASAAALDHLRAAGPAVSVKALSEHVAQHLGNTPAIARKSYIHPAVIALAQADDNGAALRDVWRGARRSAAMSRAERALLRVLETAPPPHELLAA